MAATIDTGHFFLEENGSTASSFTTAGSGTVASSVNYFAVFVGGFSGNGTLTFNSVSWNGNSLARQGRVQNAGIFTCLDLWTVPSPPAGTGTFSVTANEALGGFTFVAGIPLQNVLLSNPIGTVASKFQQTGSAYPNSLTASGAGANDIYISWTNGDVTTLTLTNGNMTSLGQTGGGVASYILGSNPGAFSWSSTGGNNTNMLAMAVAVFGTPFFVGQIMT